MKTVKPWKKLLATGAFSALFLTSLPAETLRLSLDDAVRTALRNNAKLRIGRTGMQIAKAQYEEALSGRYPRVDLTLGASRRDQDINYLAAGTFDLPQDFTNQMALSAADVQDELTAMLTNTPKTHTNLQNTYNAVQAGLIPPMSIPFEMDVTTLGRDSASARIDVSYPLYTGGRVDAVIRQAALNEKVGFQGYRRSAAEVVYDTRRYYYAVMLAEKIEKEVADTLTRLETVRDLTEAFYKGDSLRVKKTDYLRTLVTVDLARSMLEQSRASVATAKSALVNAMGLPYDTDIEISEKDFAAPGHSEGLETLVKKAYRFNPDYTTIRLAVEIADAKIDEQKSGYLPTVGLTANASHYYNSYNGGLYTDQNKNSWTIGVGLQWNIFNGFLDRAKVEEARLQKMTRRHTEVLLRKGLALRIKAAFVRLDRARKQYDTLKTATLHARQNADLHIRAYREDMVPTKDVIEAQLTEAFTRSAYYRSLHDYAANKALIDFVVCRSVEGPGEKGE